ncbi:GNAT family N-acetyltransferase [Actinoplanes bogorensis]|uniref:GNAT family N-acetyltransferase n=1 Tax=Paractinoplanes bogorensis TaxID=1610840 RepID=A0ABS5YKW0_9ACTN|nr:GNAT family N-acetyltransferase [Actinoplanes bogorensis]MBU2663681.1 GNAT family N-acetyltransferase [Actinoplanes bogorensis]
MLRTPKALLRPPRDEDLQAVRELVQDPDVVMWNPRSRIPDETAVTFSIIVDDGRYAGTVTLHDIDRAGRRAAVGYRVAPWARGRGLAAEAVRAVVDWAFGPLELERIELTHAVENTASCRVAQKAGFALEAILPANKRFGDGRLHDEHRHGLSIGTQADPAASRQR